MSRRRPRWPRSIGSRSIARVVARFTAACCAVALAAWLGACTPGREPGERSEDASPLRIAEQFGLAYAPLTLVRLRGYLEEELPGRTIVWSQLANATAIREAMIADRLDVGFMGIPPFLIGADRGMEWRIFAALSHMPMGLITFDPSLARFEDLDRTARIAVPQPGSIQHILIAMAADRYHGDPTFFDNRLASMAHPDASQALITRSQITAYLAPPPFLAQLTALPHAHVLLTGEEAFGGPFTFIVGVIAPAGGPQTIDGSLAAGAVARALARAIAALEADPEAVAAIAAEYEMDASDLAAQLTAAGVAFGGDVVGIDRFVDFMKRTGYLRQEFPSDAGRYLLSPGSWTE